MNITVNGKKEEIEEQMTVLDFLQIKEQDPEKVIIVYNDDVKDREKWDEITLEENDSLEVLRFVGGG